MAATGSRYTYLAAATAAVTDRFVASTDFKVGAYTVANAAPAVGGARLVTVTDTKVDAFDTPGTVLVTGTDLDGSVISESIVPIDGTATGAKFFASVTAVVGAAWVAGGGADAITVGHAAASIVHDGDGVLRYITIGEAAAGAITIADSVGTIAVLKASIAEHTYQFDVEFSTYLSVTAAAATKLTVSSS